MDEKLKNIYIIYISLSNPNFILPIYRSGVIYYTITPASVLRSRHFRHQFLYTQDIYYFNNFNLYVIFLTLTIYNLTTCTFKTTDT